MCIVPSFVGKDSPLRQKQGILSKSMKRVHKGISEIVIMVSGVGLLILVTVVGLTVNKMQAEAAKKEEVELKKAMITPTPLPTATPFPTSTRMPTPTKISSPSATLTPVASASATVSSTTKPTNTPTVKVTATPTKAP